MGLTLKQILDANDGVLPRLGGGAVGELAEVIAAPYTAWVAPAGTAFPTLETEEASFASSWTKIGTSGNLNYSEAGVTVTHTQTQGQFVSAGGITPRKKWRTDEGMQVAFDLVDLSPKQYALIMDEATVTTVTGAAGEQSFQLKRGINVHVYALLLRGTSTLNESKKGQYEIATACQMANPAPKFALKGGPAMLALQFDVLEFEAGKWAIFRQHS
jgi:hypothetical protein